MRSPLLWCVTSVLCLITTFAAGEVGDPQIRTDHPWYPGELACSSFERLAATQAEVYERVVGRRPESDQDKALASWLWRNTHYAHAEEANENLWGEGFSKGLDLRGREYWTGLFAHGFGLCGTTHSQWTAEMQALFGHGRGRGVGVAGHNSFEVFLTGGAYGAGRWALLDHDVSTVVFNADGSALLSIKDVQKNWKQLTDRRHQPDRQHGWLVCGLHANDGSVFQKYAVAEYLAGYSGPPPRVQLRRGETLRRYLEPGLEDGRTFVFWGRNYLTGGVPGPERSQTWVNQPEKMHGSRDGTPFRPGQARYGNAVFTYRPNFQNGDYREGVVSEDDTQVTFEFQSPFLIGATPANDTAWGVYDDGAKGGMVLAGDFDCRVSISTDRGQTWRDGGAWYRGADLTDLVKGQRQYWLRIHASAKQLATAKNRLTITTVCQANPAVMPRLKDGGSTIHFETSRTAVVSAGPNLPQAAAHRVDGQFGSPRVTLELKTPRGEPAVEIFAAAHVRSSSPPNPSIKYQIEYSLDAGRSWQPIVRDWTVPRRGDEPPDFWSQSMCYGSLKLAQPTTQPVRIRFKNDGGKAYARAEAHLVYRTPTADPTLVTFHWQDEKGRHTQLRQIKDDRETFTIPTGANTKTKWIEFATVTADNDLQLLRDQK